MNNFKDESLKEIIKYFYKKFNEIKEDKNLKIYQKLLLIECITSLYYECESKEKILNSKFDYYLMDKKEEDSILDIIEKFFKEFRKKLTEESPIFKKLIELGGDSGFYENESFYCFSMKNLDELRKHLK